MFETFFHNSSPPLINLFENRQISNIIKAMMNTSFGVWVWVAKKKKKKRKCENVIHETKYLDIKGTSIYLQAPPPPTPPLFFNWGSKEGTTNQAP